MCSLFGLRPLLDSRRGDYTPYTHSHTAKLPIQRNTRSTVQRVVCACCCCWASHSKSPRNCRCLRRTQNCTRRTLSAANVRCLCSDVFDQSLNVCLLKPVEAARMCLFPFYSEYDSVCVSLSVFVVCVCCVSFKRCANAEAEARVSNRARFKHRVRSAQVRSICRVAQLS